MAGDLFSRKQQVLINLNDSESIPGGSSRRKQSHNSAVPPCQRGALTIPWMRRVCGVRCQDDAVGGEPSGSPARRGFGAIGDIRGRRRVDDMDALVLSKAAIVNVSVHVRLNLRSSHQKIPEFLRVDQSARKVQWVAAQTWIVVRDNDCWPGRSGV